MSGAEQTCSDAARCHGSAVRQMVQPDKMRASWICGFVARISEMIKRLSLLGRPSIRSGCFRTCKDVGRLWNRRAMPQCFSWSERCEKAAEPQGNASVFQLVRQSHTSLRPRKAH
jgi:hypothetical protein